MEVQNRNQEREKENHVNKDYFNNLLSSDVWYILNSLYLKDESVQPTVLKVSPILRNPEPSVQLLPLLHSISKSSSLFSPLSMSTVLCLRSLFLVCGSKLPSECVLKQSYCWTHFPPSLGDHISALLIFQYLKNIFFTYFVQFMSWKEISTHSS